MPEFPVWNFEKIQSLIPSAFTIAFLAGIEALLSAVVADGMTGYRHRSNQELVGQGVANIASAMFGGLPATGAIARTATNIKSGGKTPLAGIFHALFLLIFILFAIDIIAFIPMTALAAILFSVAWNMSEIGHFISIFRLSRTDATVMILTFLLTVLVDLTVAIGVGVTLACLLFIKHMTQAVEIKAEGQFKEPLYEEDEVQRRKLPEGVEVFRITGPFFFGVANDLVDILKSLGQMPRVLILRMHLVPYLDATGESVLESVVRQCNESGTKVILSGLRPQPLQIIKNAHLSEGQADVLFSSNYTNAIKMADRFRDCRQN